MSLFYFLFGFVVLERLVELKIANSHRIAMLSRGAVEYDKEGYKFIVMLHIFFLTSLVVENYFHGRINYLSVYFFSIFLISQIVRYWCIISLGDYWNTRILILKGSKLIKKGPYKYFKHPNYIVVIAEFLIIPLIFSLYYSCIIFSIMNIIVIRRRIRVESGALGFT